MLLMWQLKPVLAEERATESEAGLWTTKAHGEVKEGDSRNSPVYCQGTVELRQLRGEEGESCRACAIPTLAHLHFCPHPTSIHALQSAAPSYLAPLLHPHSFATRADMFKLSFKDLRLVWRVRHVVER